MFRTQSPTHSGYGSPASSPAVGPLAAQRSNSYSRATRLVPVLRALLIIATATSVLSAAATRLTYNFTPSEPRGLYFLAPGALTRGDLVTLPIPRTLDELVRSRNYLPPRFRLLKAVVALPGDPVCIDNVSYTANHILVSTVAHSDASGRPLTPYSFCSRVPPGYAFVASAAPSSLDSRYAGPVPISTLTKAIPLWTY